MNTLTGDQSFDQYWREMMGKLVATVAGDAHARVFVKNCAVLPEIIMQTASDMWTPLTDETKSAVKGWMIVAGLVAYFTGYDSKITSIMEAVFSWLIIFPFLATGLGWMLSDDDLGRFFTVLIVLLGLVGQIFEKPPTPPLLERRLRRHSVDAS